MSNESPFTEKGILNLFNDPNLPGLKQLSDDVISNMAKVFEALNKLDDEFLKNRYLRHMYRVIESLIDRYKGYGIQPRNIDRLGRRINKYCKIIIEKIKINNTLKFHNSEEPREITNRLIRDVKGGRRTRKNMRNKRKTSKKSRANRKRTSRSSYRRK